MTKQALMIFTKNPVVGKVKTRLAATIGNEAAVSVYKQLLQQTIATTQDLPFDRFVFYSDYISQDDIWDKSQYNKKLQQGDDLGEKMNNAFVYLFENRYKKVVIIGTDCPSLNKHIILDAFSKLDDVDVVIGPAYDGGYYLLGMKQTLAALFIDMEWSTPKVLPETIQRCKQHGLMFLLLQTLHDIDEEKDLQTLKLQIQ